MHEKNIKKKLLNSVKTKVNYFHYNCVKINLLYFFFQILKAMRDL